MKMVFKIFTSVFMAVVLSNFSVSTIIRNKGKLGQKYNKDFGYEILKDCDNNKVFWWYVYNPLHNECCYPPYHPDRTRQSVECYTDSNTMFKTMGYDMFMHGGIDDNNEVEKMGYKINGYGDE